MMLARLPKSTALPTVPWEVIYTKPTTTVSSKTYDFYDIQQELINILPVDLTLLLLVAVLLAGFLAFRLIKCCRSRRYFTYVYIQVSDAEKSVKWLLASLPYLPIHYKVEASRSSSITLTQGYLSATVSLTGMLKVICKPWNSEVTISREGQMCGWPLFKLRKILSNNYCVTLLIFDNKTLIDVAMLRGWSQTEVLPTAGTSDKLLINQLYPVLWFRSTGRVRV